MTFSLERTKPFNNNNKWTNSYFVCHFKENNFFEEQQKITIFYQKPNQFTLFHSSKYLLWQTRSGLLNSTENTNSPFKKELK
jgi:hypothetical protein